MRIQSLLFARQFKRRPAHSGYDAQEVSLITPFLDGLPHQFPARLSRQALVSLWRPSPAGTARFRLRFQQLDPSGQRTAHPCPGPFETEFQDGQRVCVLLARLDLEFPTPGLSSLDIMLDGGSPQDVFHFKIETALNNGYLPMWVGSAFRADGLPPGLSVNSSNGVVTGIIEQGPNESS